MYLSTFCKTLQSTVHILNFFVCVLVTLILLLWKQYEIYTLSSEKVIHIKILFLIELLMKMEN